MMKQRRSPWPYPGDTPVDRARHVARELHQRLAHHAPDEAAAIARTAAALGEAWLTPRPVIHQDHDWITLEDAATYVNGTAEMIYKWTRREPNPLRTRTDDRGRILVQLGDVLDRDAEQRKRRAQRSTKRAS